MRIEEPITCAECESGRDILEWLENEGVCPECNCKHVYSRLHVALNAVRSGDLDGWDFSNVVEEFGLEPEEVTNLLIVLGASHEAALDIERTYVGDWPRSEWRRLINEERERERENLEEVKKILGEKGIVIEFEDE